MRIYEDLSDDELVRRCAESRDSGLWQEFIRRYNKAIASQVIRTARGSLPPETLDDLIQETYLKLCAKDCKNLSRFVAQHPNAIFGYLQAVARTVVLDYFKRRRAPKRSPEGDAVPLEDVDPPAPPVDPYWDIWLGQIGEYVRACAGEHHALRNLTIFWMHYQQGMTTAEIACLQQFSLGEKGVGTLLGRMVRCVREKLVALGSGPHVKSTVGQP